MKNDTEYLQDNMKRKQLLSILGPNKFFFGIKILLRQHSLTLIEAEAHHAELECLCTTRLGRYFLRLDFTDVKG